MKTYRRYSLLVVLILVSAFQVADRAGAGPGKTYYVDSGQGDDRQDGLTPARAWKTLEKVNATTFAPGDRILLKAGSTFSGRLAPRGSGTAEHPIVVDSYAGNQRPLVAAGGNFHEALLLKNQEYWEVSNLELTNTGPTREPFRYGARVMAWDYGTVHHIRLNSLFVHDVNGSLVKQEGKDKGEGHGIVWENGGARTRSRFEDLVIENCQLLRTDRNGICGFTEYWAEQKPRFPSLGVIIRKNLLEDIGGDAIKPWGCEGALVEYNTVRGGRQRCEDYAAGIWPWDSANTVIQFNEVSGMKGTKDGQAFDSDAYCANTIFQYNYSHDNDGGFMLICGVQNEGTVIRYNISQNDRTRLFHFYDLIQGTRIYNNVFFLGENSDVDLFEWTPGGSGWAVDTQILNNIFYIRGVGRNAHGIGKKQVDDGRWITKPGFGGAKTVLFRENVLYGRVEDVPEDWKSWTRDPMLVRPGTGRDGFESLGGYQLQTGSPCSETGTPIPGNGGRDFWGNPVAKDRNPSIGAFEPVQADSSSRN